jgi:thiol reductant ABC exporter CydD subunit
VSPRPPRRPRLVQPELAARVPGLRRAAATGLVVGALSALAIVVQAVALARVVDRSLLHHATLASVRPELAVLAAAMVARALLVCFGELSAHGTGEVVVATLRRQLLHQMLALGPGWLAGERPGELSLTATRGLRSLQAYFARYLPQAAMAGVVPVLLLAWVATQSWLALVVALALVIAVPLTMIYFGREAARRSERQWRRLGSLAGRYLQLIEGLPTLRAFGRQAHGRREVAEATEGVRVATMRTLRVAFLSALSMDLIAGFGVGLVAMVLGLRLLWGELDLQTAMAVLLVAPEIFVPLRRAGAEFHASTEGQAAAARVLEVLGTGTGPGPGPGNVTGSPVAVPPAPVPGPAVPSTLTMDGVMVEYEDRDRPALQEFSLQAAPGARLALVGPSGSGKSTVLAVLLGFVSPSAGTMEVGGHPASGTGLAAWRSHFAWLPQRPYLFTASLGENLRLGAPEAGDDELRRVLDAVGLGELVAHLPGGLGTGLGQDGLTLSAGERQRVALARALLSPAPILLLDEPTASLDPSTSKRMAVAIAPWLEGRTVLVAAHEPALLPRFDTVIALGAPTPLPRTTPMVPAP